MRIGISGHQSLAPDSSWAWVRGALKAILEEQETNLTGVSSLAVGTDQLFAELVLALHGKLHAVIPFDGYERTFTSNDSLIGFKRLLARANTTETLSAAGSDQERFLAAGKRVADLSQIIIVVWDGLPARGLGGTADIVKYASEIGLPTTQINPVAKIVTTVR